MAEARGIQGVSGTDGTPRTSQRAQKLPALMFYQLGILSPRLDYASYTRESTEFC